MTQHAHLDPSAFFLAGGPVGVLLLHGFTGAPPEMRLLGDDLHAHGYTVSAPLLPGHGATVEAMNRCRWIDWAEHAAQALDELRSQCEQVFVGGLSMGAVLTLYLTAHHHGLSGAMLYSPAVLVADWMLPLSAILKYIIPIRTKSGGRNLNDPQAHLHLWSYDEHPIAAAHEFWKLQRRVRRRLPQVVCPLLIIHSTGDSVIHPQSAQYTYERAGSQDKTLLTLHDSGHCLTVDSEWEWVAERTRAFIQSHT